jgi:hypothetical protein
VQHWRLQESQQRARSSVSQLRTASILRPINYSGAIYRPMWKAITATVLVAVAAQLAGCTGTLHLGTEINDVSLVSQ